MRNHRNIAAAALAALIVPLALVSCSGAEGDDETTEVTTTTPRTTETSTATTTAAAPIDSVWQPRPTPETSGLLKKAVSPFFTVDFTATSIIGSDAAMTLGQNERMLYAESCNRLLDGDRLAVEGVKMSVRDVRDRGEADPPVDAPKTKSYREMDVDVDMAWPGQPPVGQTYTVRSILDIDPSDPTNVTPEQVICM